jgi:hypothetical protein
LVRDVGTVSEVKISSGAAERFRAAGVGVLVGVLLGGVVVLVGRVGFNPGNEAGGAVQIEEPVGLGSEGLVNGLEEAMLVPEGVSQEAMQAREACVRREMERRVPESERREVVPGSAMPEWFQQELIGALEACPIEE